MPTSRGVREVIRFLLGWWALAALPLSAQEEPSKPGLPSQPASAVLPRLSGHITVDGNLDDPAWSEAVVVDRFYEIVPGDNVEPSAKTIGLLGYDDEFLYVGARCLDPDPSQIRAPYVDRDQVLDQDLVQIDIDARNEGRWSMIFRVNPRGIQLDGVFDEATGGDDYSPDFHFDSAARIGAEGWTAEMKIPLSTLRYRAGEPQTWRIIFFRLYPRDFRYQMASTPIPRGSNCWLCHAPRFTDITGLSHSSNLTYTPFVTGRASEDPGARPKSEQKIDAGGDVKWLPRPDLAVDLTLNPDFSQIESDAPQISINNRFALFFPEKRPFFLEGSDLLNSPIQIVNTRTITEPDWGVRLTGRPGDSAYTVLVTKDKGGGSLILPGPVFSRLVPQPEDETVVLARYRRTFGGSSLGALATGREAKSGEHNRVAGADFQWLLSEHDRTTGQLLWSSTRDRDSPEKTDYALHLDWAHTVRHLDWTLQLQDLGRDFRADSGFVPQTGVRHVTAETGYTFYPTGIFRQVRPLVSFDQVDERNGPLVARTLYGGVSFDGQVQGVVEWHPREEGRAFDGQIFEQSYWYATARVLPSRKLPYLKVTARYGDEIDFGESRLGTGTTVALVARLSPIDRLQAELTGERHWLEVPEGSRTVRAFLATVSQAKVTYAFTARSFSRLIGQWEALELGESGGSDDSFSGSVLYGYRLNWQSILYVGYGNEPGEGLLPDRSRREALFVKVAYAFRQ
jgi:hypothetical protein